MEKNNFNEKIESMKEIGIVGLDVPFLDDLINIKKLCEENGLSKEFDLLFDGFYKHTFIISDTYLSVSLHNALMKRKGIKDKIEKDAEK